MRPATPDARILSALLIVLGLCCAAGFYRAVAIVGLPVPLDPNEGWNAYHQVAAISGGAFYPGPHAFMINNYPPLSFYLVGALGVLLGDNIVAGRVVSLAAFLFVAVMIGLSARRMGCGRAACL